MKDYEGLVQSEIIEKKEDLKKEETNTPPVEENKKVKRLEITEDDKNKFEIALLEDIPYEEKIEIIKGKLFAVFQTRTVDDSCYIISALSSLGDKSSIVEIEMHRTKYFLAAMLKELVDNAGKKLLSLENKNIVGKIETINKMPSPKFSILLGAMMLFEDKVDRIRKAAEDFFLF